jgi:tetratricopeptide (TPR) repeat protein
MNLTKQHIYVIVGVIVLVVLLLMAPKTQTPKATDEIAQSSNKDELKSYVDSLTKTLSAEQLKLIEAQEKATAYDSVAKIWLKFKQPIAAASFFEKNAIAKSNADNWFMAGKRYYTATKFPVFNTNLRMELFANAIRCMEKTLALDSLNLEAQTIMGACYVEGSQEPMKGIMMLRKVLQNDSTYIDAHLKLAMFAVQSQQYDKAIERFNKILRIDKNYIEAYIYLGETYAAMGNKEMAIKSLDKFRSLTTNSLMASEVEKYINELKNN